MNNNIDAIKRKIFGNTKIISEYLNSDNKDSRKKRISQLVCANTHLTAQAIYISIVSSST